MLAGCGGGLFDNDPAVAPESTATAAAETPVSTPAAGTVTGVAVTGAPLAGATIR